MTAIDERALAAIIAPELEKSEAVMTDPMTLRRLKAERIARAVLQALSPGSTGETEGWQPIETAPKDGTPFLGYLPADRFPAVCFWQAYDQADAKEIGADGYWAFGEELISDVEGHAVITHWRPLPEPPSAMLAAAGGRDE